GGGTGFRAQGGSAERGAKTDGREAADGGTGANVRVPRRARARPRAGAALLRTSRSRGAVLPRRRRGVCTQDVLRRFRRREPPRRAPAGGRERREPNRPISSPPRP